MQEVLGVRLRGSPVRSLRPSCHPDPVHAMRQIACAPWLYLQSWPLLGGLLQALCMCFQHRQLPLHGPPTRDTSSLRTGSTHMALITPRLRPVVRVMTCLPTT